MQRASRHVVTVTGLMLAIYAQLGCAPESAAPAPPPAVLPQPLPPSREQAMYPSTGVGFWDPVVSAKHSASNDSDKADDLNAEEKARAIAIAKQYLEEESDQAIGYEFQVSRRDDGYFVFVEFVFGHDDQGHPLHAVGGHCAIVISSDWKVTSVIGGL